MQVLGDVTGDEFIAFVKILQQLKSMQTLVGRQLLLDIVTDQADLDSKFEVCLIIPMFNIYRYNELPTIFVFSLYIGSIHLRLIGVFKNLF